ncbi:D-alanyl-D-alanine dipeptidase [Sedimentibacter acidaminivorans]|uniref:D-alanyl-D-alanine dipeptidase n=1 Tax=Sedimentibacter acidaminivorans TaxID=913099 RepID=A0ABS4GH58_9FIRM|nr:M15 family metallopeptidase [Sedimentibacter acidaminivorans]MBP1927019.1 D-alanyl-D-alanine dipeptidase [Sedimentibacter acidaminivorans]
MSDKDSLVRLLDLDPEFIIDIKYATDNNFTKQRVYNFNDCYLNKDTAILLIKAKKIFKKDGYKVKVWDAYRPIRAQKLLFEIVPIDDFVATPPDMRKPIIFEYSHMNGLSVDITLVDSNGNELEMPTEFDDFTEMAGLGCDKIPPQARKNAEYLKSVMESVGFKAYRNEWWHFNDVVTKATPYSDVEFN